MPQTEDAVFYQLHFQTPGVAEAELEHDVRASIRGILCRLSGDAPAGHAGLQHGAARRRPAGAQPAPLPATLPGWLTEADIDYLHR